MSRVLLQKLGITYAATDVVHCVQSMAGAEEGAEEDLTFYDSTDLDDADMAAAELEGFDAGGMGKYTAAVIANGYASEQPDTLESVDGFVTDGRGFYSSMLVRAAAPFGGQAGT